LEAAVKKPAASLTQAPTPDLDTPHQAPEKQTVIRKAVQYKATRRAPGHLARKRKIRVSTNDQFKADSHNILGTEKA